MFVKVRINENGLRKSASRFVKELHFFGIKVEYIKKIPQK